MLAPGSRWLTRSSSRPRTQRERPWSRRSARRVARSGLKSPWRATTSPEHGIGELSSIYSGQGKQAEDEKEHLSAIINVVNERFGMQLGTADQLFFDQLEETWAADEALVAQARANDLANFRLPFTDVFLKTIVGRMDDNADIFKRILDEPAFQATVL